MFCWQYVKWNNKIDSVQIHTAEYGTFDEISLVRHHSGWHLLVGAKMEQCGFLACGEWNSVDFRPAWCELL